MTDDTDTTETHTSGDTHSSERTDTETMADVSHTNPYTDRSFGDAMVFHRGAVAADGGERDVGPRSSSDQRSNSGRAEGEDAAEEAEPDTMEDVSHEAPDGDSPQRTFERGTEGRTDTV